MAVSRKMGVLVLSLSFCTSAFAGNTKVLDARQPGKRPPIKYTYSISSYGNGERSVDISPDASNDICGDYFKPTVQIAKEIEKPIAPKLSNANIPANLIPFPADEPMMYFASKQVDGKNCLKTLIVNREKREETTEYLSFKEPHNETDTALTSLIFAAFQAIALH